MTVLCKITANLWSTGAGAGAGVLGHDLMTVLGKITANLWSTGAGAGADQLEMVRAIIITLTNNCRPPRR